MFELLERLGFVRELEDYTLDLPPVSIRDLHEIASQVPE